MDETIALMVTISLISLFPVLVRFPIGLLVVFWV